MSDVLSYLDSKGIQYNKIGDQVYITCPECGKNKLTININSGVAHCFVCKAEHPDSWTCQKGFHIKKLMEYNGDLLEIKSFSSVGVVKDVDEEIEIDFTDLANKNHKALLENISAQKYLFKRGITQESIEKFNIGYSEEPNNKNYGQGWISIPSYENNIVKLVKYRKLLPDVTPKLPKYIRETGCKSILFNGDCIENYEELFVAEGELDAITLLQNGFKNTIGITVGAQTLDSEWYDKLSTKKKLYLVFDADDAGQNSAKSIWAERLGSYRCVNVRLPDGEDINSYFLKYTIKDFKKLVEQAEKFLTSGVSSVKDVIREMYRLSISDVPIVYETPWPSLNKLIGGGLKFKNLTILSGQAGIGKTSMGIQIALYMAKEYNLPSFIFCLEMSEVELLKKIIQLEFNLDYHEVDNSDAFVYYHKLKELPLYFGYQPRLKLTTYENTAKAVRDRFGCKFFMFDNIHRLIVSDNESDYSKGVKVFKDLAMDLNIMMLLLAQPRKLNSRADEEGYSPNYDDLKGSAAFSQDADEILLIHRQRIKGESSDQTFSSKAMIINDKARFSSGGKCILSFIGSRSKYVEYDKNL